MKNSLAVGKLNFHSWSVLLRLAHPTVSVISCKGSPSSSGAEEVAIGQTGQYLQAARASSRSEKEVKGSLEWEDRRDPTRGEICTAPGHGESLAAQQCR